MIGRDASRLEGPGPRRRDDSTRPLALRAQRVASRRRWAPPRAPRAPASRVARALPQRRCRQVGEQARPTSMSAGRPEADHPPRPEARPQFVAARGHGAPHGSPACECRLGPRVLLLPLEPVESEPASAATGGCSTSGAAATSAGVARRGGSDGCGDSAPAESGRGAPAQLRADDETRVRPVELDDVGSGEVLARTHGRASGTRHEPPESGRISAVRGAGRHRPSATKRASRRRRSSGSSSIVARLHP